MPRGGVGKEKNTKEKLSKKQYGEKQNRSDTCETFSSKFFDEFISLQEQNERKISQL